MLFRGQNYGNLLSGNDFCKFYGETVKNNALEEPDGKRHRNKPNRLSYAEVITILVAFHMGGHRRLKHFYLEFVCRHWTHLFPKTVSYNRFVELEREVALLLPVFVRHVLLGKCTGISFVDSISCGCAKTSAYTATRCLGASPLVQQLHRQRRGRHRCMLLLPQETIHLC